VTDLSHNWQPLQPDEVQELLKDLPAPWWIAGGWAIDLFLGRQTRDHLDIDVLILRRDGLALREYLSGWDLHKAQQPGLKPWAAGEYLPVGVNDVWARRDPSSPWVVEFMLMGTDNDHWVYRRQPEIRGAVSGLGLLSDDGIPYLRPEIQLLYKAKAVPDAKDRHDFELVVPQLERDSREWLLRALSLQFPRGHQWIDHLRRRV
jgi:hypothetical protein